MRGPRGRRWLRAGVLGVAVLPALASGATNVWDGGVDNSWATAGNWTNDIALSSGDSVEFYASGNNLNTLLGQDWVIDRLLFNAGADNDVTIGGANTLTISNGITVDSGALGTNVIAATVALAQGQTWTLGGASPFTVSGGISGAAGLTKAGTGTLILSGSNSYSGGTTVDGGILRLATNLAIPGNVTVNSGGTLDVYGQDIQARAPTVTVSGAGAAGTVGALTATRAGESRVRNVTLAGDATVGTDFSKLNFYGTINGGGNTLTVAGSGESNLRVNNALTNLAGITVATTGGGRLRFESSQSPTAPLTMTVNSGGRVDTYASRTMGTNLALDLKGGILEANGNNNTTNTALWQGGVTISSNSFVRANSSASALWHIALAGPVGGSGGLIKDGGATLFLGGSNSYGGPTIVSNGTLTVSGGFAIPDASAVTLANAAGAALVLSNSETIGSLTGGGTTGGNVSLNANTLTVGGDGTSPAAFGGVIGGSGGVTKIGAGTLTLSGTNTYSGLTTINGGVVRVSSSSNLGDGGAANDLAFGGGTLQASGTFATGRDVQLNSGGGTFLVDNGITMTVTGIVSGAGDFTKTGLGTVVFGNAGNDYTGRTLIHGGTLSIATNSHLGALPGTAVADSIVLANGGTLRSTATQTLQAQRGITLGEGGGVLDASSGGFYINGNITGGTGLKKTGGADLILQPSSGSNVIGALEIVSARLFFNGQNAIGLGDITVRNGATLDYQGNAAALTLENLVILDSGARVAARNSTAGLTLREDTVLPTAGSLVVNSDDQRTTNVTVLAGVNLSGDLTIQVGGQNTTNGHAIFTGAIGGSGGVTKTGDGTLRLLGANSYAGKTVVGNGTLWISNETALGASPGSFTADQLKLAGGTLRMTEDLAIDDANRGIMVTNGTFFVDAGKAASIGSPIAGGGTLTKSGSGTLDLEAVNPFGGTGVVQAGRLNVNGTLAAALTSVKSGATLGGSGAVGGQTIFESGSTHSPGNSPGLQRFAGGLVYSNGATLVWELNTNGNALALRGVLSGYDGVNLTNGQLLVENGAAMRLTFDGAGSAVDWGDAFWSSNREWLVISFLDGSADYASGSTNFTLNAASEWLDKDGDLLGANPWNSAAGFVTLMQSDGVYLQYQVPEPGAWAALAAAGVMVAGLRRKRFKFHD